MQVRFRLAALVAVMMLAGATAGASLASHYVEGGLAPASAPQSSGGSTAGQSGQSSSSGDNTSQATDPEGSAKSKKHYGCADEDGSFACSHSKKKPIRYGVAH